jgi:hypothetical protein
VALLLAGYGVCLVTFYLSFNTHAIIMKANWTGHILRRNCFLKHVSEEKVEGRGDGKTRMKT